MAHQARPTWRQFSREQPGQLPSFVVRYDVIGDARSLIDGMHGRQTAVPWTGRALSIDSQQQQQQQP